jgi:nicotinic acid phosphoribosyltransferase
MIIDSLLDTDLYKFTMMQVVLHHFPGAQVEYRFKCRNPGVQLAPFVEDIRSEISHLCTLRFSESELQYLRGLRFIKSDFVDFLRIFQFQRDFITVRDNACPSEKFLKNANGPGNLWTNNGPQVSAEIKAAAGLEPAFRGLLPDTHRGN